MYTSRLGLFVYLALIMGFGPLVVNAQSVLPQIDIIPNGNQSVLADDVYILVEANTYVPSFYQGRPEPTAGNPLDLIAITNIDNQTNLRYQWKVGLDSFTTNNPRLTTTAPDLSKVLVSVTVTDGSGRTVARSSEYISISKPVLAFYENNPLRAESQIGIGKTYTLTGDEVDIFAEPYFVGSRENTVTTWTIDGVAQNSFDPFRLTILRPEDTSKPLLVVLNTYNTTRLSERGKGDFTLNFSL